MTIIWFVVWLVAGLIGDHEALRFDPVNWWTATLILAIALDLNRPQVLGARKGDPRPAEPLERQAPSENP
jgi:hypothetical protein